MKKFIYSAAFLLMFSSCEYDNYDSPQSQLTGRFVYEGEPVGVKQGLNVLQLYEPGWDTFDPIGVNVKQEGIFSALLYNGDYQLVLLNDNGPWVNQPDTIDIHIEGSRELDIPVEPFFMIRNESFEVSGSNLTASFNVEQIVEAKQVQFVSLFIGKTMLVDNQFKAKEKRLPSGGIGDLNETINLELDLSNINQDFIFARIGVKTQGSPDLVFSKVQRIEL